MATRGFKRIPHEAISAPKNKKKNISPTAKTLSQLMAFQPSDKQNQPHGARTPFGRGTFGKMPPSKLGDASGPPPVRFGKGGQFSGGGFGGGKNGG